MSVAKRLAAVVVAAMLVVTMSTTVGAASPSVQPSTSTGPAPDAVTVTVRVRDSESCPFGPDCSVGVRITPVGSDTPVIEGTLDATSTTPEPGDSLTTTASPGTYAVSVTALAVTEEALFEDPDDPTPVTIGGCGAALELLADQVAVEITAAMAWDQPACGIVIDPRPSNGLTRPILADPIRQGGPPPRFRPRGAPTATATANGIRLDLWIKDATLARGQWLLAHLRVTIVGRKAITFIGRFGDLDCPPLRFTADTSALFDPGITWQGIAGTYKERFLGDGHLLRAPLGIPKRDRGNGCGDVGYGNRLEPGAVEDVPLAGMPAYPLRAQPLPPGTIQVTAAFNGPRFRGPDLASVSTDVTLAGDSVDYPSPGQLVDAALSTPGFIEILERAHDLSRWANSHLGRPRHPFRVARLAAAQAARVEVVEIVQFVGSDIESPFVVAAAIDPWTGESYGSSWF